jgi:serine/threonine protein kinase/tetratricopeptide (TPR) repeat protein
MSQRGNASVAVPAIESRVVHAPPLSRRRAQLDSLGGTENNHRLPRLPVVGNELFGFRLQHELGRGAFACVFLAEQPDLARRPVVLKISGTDGDEPQTLAQLQHTHIVPIHSVHEDRRTGLRAVCMPYFGGASLSRVLQILFSENDRPTQGRQLLRALETVQNPTPERASQVAEGGPGNATGSSFFDPRSTPSAPLAILGGLSYVRAAAWIVARLAEAVQHAHQRGVLHRDIKPSNILLGADGQPMLLDFNVAQNLRNAREKAVADLGGTVAYMAPEHLRAVAAHDPALARLVDHRADLYSLGMVLYELLAGCGPFEQSASYSPVLPLVVAMALERSRGVPSLREKRPDVPWSLESIARKCLAPDPALRYQQAEHLAEDLRCFLEDRPLKYAPELSRTERIRKWLRRHPRLTSSGSVATAAALLLIASGAALIGVREHLARAREQLAAVHAEERKRAYQDGTLRALCLVNTTTDVSDHLRQGLSVCERTLALYGVLDRDDWQEESDWQRLTPDERQALAEDTRELLLLLAWARVRSAPRDPDVLRQALALLDRAEALGGLAPSRALWEDRTHYLEQLGRAGEAQAAAATAKQLQPVSARDHYLLATTYARKGRYSEAVAQLRDALRLNPRHYWSLVQRGICYQELGKHVLAAADFGACIGLWPEFAWGHFNRGYALDQTGNRAEAIGDYTAALERDPGFLLAYFNRGMARLELKRYAEALADLDKAAELGRGDASLHAGRGVALEGLGRTREADEAFNTAFAQAQAGPPETRLRIRWVYGFAISARRPEQARAAFEDVLRQYPQHPQALYGRAMLLVAQGRELEALSDFDRAIEAAPSFVEARRFRAVLFARRGHFDDATRDMNWCLEKEPEAGATLYAAACVAARAVERSLDPSAAKQATEQALTFLQKAFARGYGRQQAAQDPDLAGIQKHPEFLRLLAKAP